MTIPTLTKLEKTIMKLYMEQGYTVAEVALETRKTIIEITTAINALQDKLKED